MGCFDDAEVEDRWTVTKQKGKRHLLCRWSERRVWYAIWRVESGEASWLCKQIYFSSLYSTVICHWCELIECCFWPLCIPWLMTRRVWWWWKWQPSCIMWHCMLNQSDCGSMPVFITDVQFLSTFRGFVKRMNTCKVYCSLGLRVAFGSGEIGCIIGVWGICTPNRRQRFIIISDGS